MVLHPYKSHLRAREGPRHSRGRAPRACHGFTLIESLVVLAFLGFVLAGVSSLMLSTIATNNEARRFSAAAALAQQKLEDLRATGYSGATSWTLSESLDENGTTTGVTMFTRSWTVSAGTVANTKNISGTVTWSDKRGDHTDQIQSILAQC